MESVITRSENPFTKPLIVIFMMAIVLLGAMTLAHAVKRHGQVVHDVVKTCGPGTEPPNGWRPAPCVLHGVPVAHATKWQSL